MSQNKMWKTPEQVVVKPKYNQKDLAEARHLGTLPGDPPFVRGPYKSMYVGRPWTVRQYAGFSTATESNLFYRRNLAAGQKGNQLMVKAQFKARPMKCLLSVKLLVLFFVSR